MVARAKLTPARKLSLTAQAALASGTREAWMESALPVLGAIFEDAGYPLPPVRVSCSFPGGGTATSRIGECWPTQRSAFAINEIFISPVLDDPAVVLGVLVHELAHAVDDCASGHGAGYKTIATKVGLVGKMKHAYPGEALKLELAALIDIIGPYPHGRLTLSKKKPPPQRKSVVFTCIDCEFVFSVSPKMADQNEILTCPVCEQRDRLDRK